MANLKSRGVTILTALLAVLSLTVLCLLASAAPAAASEEDCLLLVLDSADGSTPTAGISIQLFDREGETHTYVTDEDGLLLVPCGLLGDSLSFEDTWGHGFCIVLNASGDIYGNTSSLLIDNTDFGIAVSPLASVTDAGSILRLGIGPGTEEPIDA